jgi:L-iditol 2-dehydrogenase
MWAQTLTAPRTFEPREVPAPTAGDLKQGEVLLRVLAGGVCGSDLPQFKGLKASSGILEGPWPPANPGAPMHEVVGEVIASQDASLEVGATVVGWASGFNAISEVVISRADGLYPYTLDLPATTGVLIQPLACVIYALEKLTRVEGIDAGIIGQGPIGLLFSHVLRTLGARSVTGVDLVDRAEVAKTYGMDEFHHASSASWAASLTDATRPGIVVEAVGHHVTTLTDAIHAAAFGGEIFYFGIPDDQVYPLNMSMFLRKNLTLRSGTTFEKARVLAKATEYLVAHPELTDSYVSDVLPADQAQTAFERAVSPRPGQHKIVLSMV